MEKNKVKQMLIRHLEVELNSYNYSVEQQQNIEAAIKLVKSIKIGGKN